MERSDVQSEDTRYTEDHKPSQRPQYYFQMVSIPESEAPLAYREAFVGKVFPMMPRNMDGPEPMEAMEDESRVLVHVDDAVCVNTSQAVQILRSAGEEQAADYWASRDFDFLIFQRSEVRVFLPHPTT